MVKLVKDKLQNSSIEQYKDEERAVLAKRIHSAENRIKRLLQIMGDDNRSKNI
jgi:ATP-dependent RNA circularization protein (DNA/RNA ligase family)